MSWTATRPVAQFGLHAASSVAVRAEQGRWDDTQKKYLSNLSKQTRQRTELSHRAALSVMCYWKNAGGMILWTQRKTAFSLLKMQRCRASAECWWSQNSAFKNILGFAGRDNSVSLYVPTCDLCTMVYCGSLFQKRGVSSCFSSFHILQMTRRARKSCSTWFC